MTASTRNVLDDSKNVRNKEEEPIDMRSLIEMMEKISHDYDEVKPALEEFTKIWLELESIKLSPQKIRLAPTIVDQINSKLVEFTSGAENFKTFLAGRSIFRSKKTARKQLKKICDQFSHTFTPLGESLAKQLSLSINQEEMHQLEALIEKITRQFISGNNTVYQKKICEPLVFLGSLLKQLKKIIRLSPVSFSFKEFLNSVKPILGELLKALSADPLISVPHELIQKLASLVTLQEINSRATRLKGINFSNQHPDYIDEIIQNLVKSKAPLISVFDDKHRMTTSQLLFLLKSKKDSLAVLRLSPAYAQEQSESHKKALLDRLLEMPKLIHLGPLFGENSNYRNKIEQKISNNSRDEFSKARMEAANFRRRSSISQI